MNSSTQSNLLYNKQKLDESRARRVWQYFFLLWVGWVFFTLQFLICDYRDTFIVSLSIVIGFALIYWKFRSDDYSNRTTATCITYSYLGLHSVGIFTNSVLCPDLESGLLAIPVAMTVVLMLLGTRAAIPWLILSVLAFNVFPIVVHGFSASLPPSPIFQDTMLKAVAAIVLFACLRNFESFYLKRADDLVELSQNLQLKTQELQTLATTDALTGLPNRFQFNEQMKQQVNDALQRDSTLALLVLDMDGFKEVNDTLGHTVGDQALLEIASRLRNLLEPQASVARLGGDEFCVLLRDVSDREDVVSLSNQLHDLLSREYQLANVTCRLGTSIGIAFCPEDAQTPEDLLTFADTAMFHAKDNHQPFAIYDTEQTKRVVEYCSIQEKLSKALALDEFFLVYQPQIDLRSGHVVGAEALLRWRHDGEIVSPFTFIPHLESSRRITEVTRWILDTVSAQIGEWNEIGLRLKIAVNISAIDFHEPGFSDMVTSTIQRHQIDPRLLELEITEGVLIEDVNVVADRLNRLKDAGLTISIDDFGTGYSSLAYIRRLPIDKLKIDRAFVKGIPDIDDGTIASTIILLAKSLGLEVLAEGIETESQREYFQSNNCDQFQGYLASRPISAEMLQELVVENNAANLGLQKTS